MGGVLDFTLHTDIEPFTDFSVFYGFCDSLKGVGIVQPGFYFFFMLTSRNVFTCALMFVLR